MSIDRSTHSLFGVSKAAADLLVQEYGRYFDMPTVCLRCGCITGPSHAGARLHGFLAYLMKCVVTGTPYTVYGYEGKQVRTTSTAPTWWRRSSSSIAPRALRPSTTWAAAGSRTARCSRRSRRASGSPVGSSTGSSVDEARIGDHRWWISDLGEFQRDYPDWKLTQGIESILQEIHDANVERWVNAPA